MALAGALACQRDSYLKELTTVVKSCEPTELDVISGGKKAKVNCYATLLEDTILFPEGGGQPGDRGKVGDAEVLQVSRRGGEAVHYLPVPLTAGSQVELQVDWQRRFDHMQQHSGQHLVTAIADQLFGYATVSWNLGEKISTIEITTPSISAEELQQIEDTVNQKIRDHLPMYPTLYHDKSDPELLKVRTRGLPDDHVGPVRVVTIEGIETNMCCGTHVANLSHLQAIKLLGVEKGKKGKTLNLVFVAGGRLLNYLAGCYSNEKALTQLLNGPPSEHAGLVAKLQASHKAAQKGCTNMLRDLASLEAERYKNNPDKDPLFVLHRPEGDSEFMNQVANEIGDEGEVKFLTTGDDKGVGMFLLCGPEKLITDVGPKVLELLEGRGAGKRGRFQGKATKLSRRPQVIQLLREAMQQPS